MWSFAEVNGRLAEIFFEKVGKTVIFNGYCYVKRFEYKTKKEQGWIEEDMKRVKVVYKGGRYEWLNKPEWVTGVKAGKFGD